jgi:hypothetical protein
MLETFFQVLSRPVIEGMLKLVPADDHLHAAVVKELVRRDKPVKWYTGHDKP